MVQTLVAFPKGLLKDYIRAYEYREFDTCGHEMLRPNHAQHEIYISIFINSQLFGYNNPDRENPIYEVDRSANNTFGLMGLQSSSKGAFVFKGRYKIFNINFKPTGFSHIFGIPAVHILNKMYNVPEVLGDKVNVLSEQLQDAKSFTELISLTETYFGKMIQARDLRHIHSGLLKASNTLLALPRACSIKDLAYQTNMTVKTFERNFAELVGLNPKLYLRINRFNAALEAKIAQPGLHWTDISNRLGYYDQMHFIKDFKEFTNSSPTYLFKNTPPPMEKIRRVD